MTHDPYEEIQNMLEKKDTLLDMYRMQLGKQDALIRELVAALDGIEKMLDQQGALIQQELVNALARQQLNARLIVLKAIRHAKQAGYEPTKTTTNEHPYSRDKLGEDC